MTFITRFYDPALGRFTSADSIVPAGVQGYDRYAYVNNNPVKYTDPSGHMATCDLEAGNGCAGTGLGGLTPSQILNAGANENQEVTAIYNYYVTHPDYNYAQDPELDETEDFLVSNAIFLGDADYASRQLNFWDRVNASWQTLAAGGGLAIAAILADGGKKPSSGLPSTMEELIAESALHAKKGPVYHNSRTNPFEIFENLTSGEYFPHTNPKYSDGFLSPSGIGYRPRSLRTGWPTIDFPGGTKVKFPFGIR